MRNSNLHPLIIIISFFGNKGDTKAKCQMNVYVNMCINITRNNTFPEKNKLKPFLENTYLYMGYIKYEVNHYDYENQVKPYLRIETFRINWDLHIK